MLHGLVAAARRGIQPIRGWARNARLQLGSNATVQRLGRWVLRSFLVVAGIELVYLAAINVLFATGGFEDWVSERSDDFTLRLEGAWSPWPGRVYADELTFVGIEDSMQFEVEIRDLDVDIAVFELFSETFHATRVRGDVGFRLRHNVHDLKEHTLRVAAFPPIEGVDFPPVYGQVEDPPSKDPWAVQLSDVDVRVHELWVVEYRFTGAARARGGFYMRAHDRLRVEPSVFEVERGTVRGGSRPAVSKTSGEIRFEMLPHNPDKARGLEQIVARVRFEAHVDDLAVAAFYLDRDDPMPSRGAGPLDVDFSVENGAFSPKSSATYRTESFAISAGPITFAGDAEVEAAVVGGSSPHLRLRTGSARVSGSTGGDSKDAAAAQPSGPAFVVKKPSLSVDFETAKVGELGFSRMVADFEKILVEDLARLNPLVNGDGGGPLLGGRLGAKSRFSLTRQKLEGHLDASLHQAGVRLGDNDLTMSGTVKGELQSGDASRASGVVKKLEIKLDEVGVRTKKGATGQFWLIAHATGGQWEGVPPEKFSLRFDIGAESFEPLLPVFVSSGILKKATTALLDLDDTAGTLTVARSPSSLRLRVHQIKSGDITVRGLWLKKNGTSCGAFAVNAGLVDVAVDIDGNKTDTDLFTSDDWLDKELRRPCRKD